MYVRRSKTAIMNKIAPKKPHFLKPIHPGFKNGIKIPKAFFKYLDGHIQEHAILRSAGKEWRVKVNGQLLEDGWGKFAEEHDLQVEDCLVFRHEGNMEFEVTIFNSNHLEREYVKPLEGVNEENEESDHAGKNFTSQDLRENASVQPEGKKTNVDAKRVSKQGLATEASDKPAPKAQEPASLPSSSNLP